MPFLRAQVIPFIKSSRHTLGYTDRTFANPRWRIVDDLPVAELNAPRRAPGPVSRLVVAYPVRVADADVSIGDAWPRARDARTRVDAAALAPVPTLVFVPASPARNPPGPAASNSFIADMRGAENALAAAGRLTKWSEEKIPAGSPGYLFSYDGTKPLEFVGWYPGK